MSIEDDVALLEGVPTLRLLGHEALRVLAIGAEQQEFARGSVLFRVGDAADCGYLVQSGSFHVSAGPSAQSEDGRAAPNDLTARPGMLIGEMALMVPVVRTSTAVALEYSGAIRIARSLFQRVLESDPRAALRLRDEMALRAGQMVGDLARLTAKF